MAKTLMPWWVTSDAAAASVVDRGLEAQSTSSAPPAFRVMARLAVSVVICRQAERRWPLSGCSRLKRSRICSRTGISWAAHSIIPGERQGAQPPTRKGITRTGRVAHRFQRMGRGKEDALLGEQQGPVLAALDDDRARSVGEDGACSRRQKALSRELHGFFVIHQHAVDP